MKDIEQLPHLLKLLEDDSPVVKEAVMKQLALYGPDLEPDIVTHYPEFVDKKRNSLESLFMIFRRKALRKKFAEWLTLEKKLDIIVPFLAMWDEYFLGWNVRHHTEEGLDALAKEYAVSYPQAHPLTLAKFLFETKGFHGDVEHYYNPLNSSLAHCLHKKTGLPLSLTLIYILVGRKLGLTLYACHWPHHFMALAIVEKRMVVIDCFANGKVFKENDFSGLDPKTYVSNSPYAIAMRVLRNILVACERSGNMGQRDFVVDRITELEEFIHARNAVPEDEQLFSPGTLVVHKSESYRGLVVDYDMTCQKTQESESSVQDPKTVWYYVLVHGSDRVTYVQHDQLDHDTSREQVVHPLRKKFFGAFRAGRYERNEAPWSK